MLGALLLFACHRRHSAEPTDATPGDTWGADHYGYYAGGECLSVNPKERACTQSARAVRVFGPTPREDPPVPTCPMRVLVAGDDVVAEPLSIANNFDPVPFPECIAPQYAVGSRRVIHVDDGFFVAYDGLFKGEMFWASEDGNQRRMLSVARIAGFARPTDGVVLALAIGKARLGKGGVLAFERDEEGWHPRLVATLPIEPSPVSFDDHGVLVGFGQGFVFRVDRDGHVENVHYVARPIGRVASIARGTNGVYYLGVECGVVRLVPVVDPDGTPFYKEEWWSSKSGASGRWASCASDP